MGALSKMQSNLLITAILLVGVALRLWGIDFGLPYTIAPDEPTHFSIGLHIFATGDLHPHWLNYPSLMFYLNVAALIPYFLAGKALGIFQSPADISFPEIVTMGVGQLAVPSEFLLSRGLTALFGVGSIYLVYRIAREFPALDGKGVRGTGVALLAALLLAVSPANVYNSHLIRPDTFAVFFALFSFLFAQRILNDPRPRNYIWAGAGAGLAVSCKYSMPLIVVPIAAAHFLRYGWRGWRQKEIYLAAGVSVAAFFGTSPYILLDLPLFMKGFGFEIYSQSLGGHAGFEGNTLPWYLNFLVTTEGFIAFAALLQTMRLLVERSRSGLVLLAFPLVYFLFISLLVVRNDRTILPILPFLHLLAAMLVADAIGWLQQNARIPHRAAIAIGVALIALMLIVPLPAAIASDQRLTQSDARDSARVWLSANLPREARIAQEAYTPYLDTRRYVVQGIDALVDRPPEWYVQSGFEYAIASSGMFGRFYADPGRYAEWIEKYERFFQRYPELKRFSDNGYEIRVYKTDAALPAHRVAARFGDYGDVIELVGYETSAPRAGEPLQLKLYWRPLRETPEPLELETRLFGQTDDEIAKVRADLFQGKGWQDKMFAVEWTIPLPNDAPSGPYRVQLNVIQTRFEYVVPTQNWRGERIDLVILSLGK